MMGTPAEGVDTFENGEGEILVPVCWKTDPTVRKIRKKGR
jgi:hypothetical protein